MIGQRALVKKIDTQIRNDKFPRFTILIGEQGSGKTTLAYHIAKEIDATPCIVSIKADDIRSVIENSYNVGDLRVLYLIKDADNISSASANALLKSVEEPPNDAYFILTCENLENLLATVKSRGVTYMMEPYTYDEKCDFVDSSTDQLEREEYEFVLDVCSNLGEIKQMLTTDISGFKEYVDLVIDNVAEVSGSNAFKIADKIALKDEEDKYSLKLFWKAFNVKCADRMLHDATEQLKYARGVAITGDYLQQLYIKGVNKQMLFDAWLLAIRSEWL